ncbi:DUF2269 domain-containing protein [Streptacidiphilus cavernicola]|uniref:DUF2269 domain-containing protein n=1 Tax=Streptacidiphilus cavernicola TaxID=3342716 RepID=A0ABV6W5P9_9ACTN
MSAAPVPAVSPSAPSPSAPSPSAPPLFRLGPGARRFWLTLHVITSVGWLGLDLGLLALGVTGRWFTPPDGELGVYRAMDLLGYAVVLPVALLALLTGVVLSLGTPWGLLRYRWVVIKLVLTVGAATATSFGLLSLLDHAVAHCLATGGPGRLGNSLVAAPIVAGTIYTTATVLSVYKPGARRTSRRARPVSPPSR